MNHLKILTEEERNAVAKFNEYGATVVVGYGNKATWADLVHDNAYSDSSLNDKIIALRTKVNNQNQLEDDDANVDKTEFILKNGMNESVIFTTEETLLFVRSAKKVRKYFSDALENAKEIAQLEKDIAKIQQRTMTPEDKLAQKTARLNQLKGIETNIEPLTH